MDGCSAPAAVIVPALAMLACGSPFAPGRDLGSPIQTEHLLYELDRVALGVETEIRYELTNRTDGPVFIVNCNGATGVLLEKRIDGRWVKAWGNVTPDCLSPPIVVASGETISRTLSVFGGDPGCECGPTFSAGDRDGIYRIVLPDVLESFDPDTYPFGAQIPKDERVSNRFRLLE